jgi:hypothetical protein
MSDLPVFQLENVSGGCYSYTIRKLERVSKLERVKMTNRIFEQGNTPQMEEWLGYVKCSKCERVTAWETCVMCR